MSRVRIKDAGVIFDAAGAPENQRNCAFTSATLLKDGTILVAFRNATGRDAPDGRLRIMRSRDQGAKWETLHPGMTATINGVEGNLYGGFFTEFSEDRLLRDLVWVDRSNPDLSFVNPETTGLLPMRALLAESSDGGANWGPFRALDLSPQTGCSVTGPIMPLPGGEFGSPYESWKDYDDASFGRHIASLRISDDDGETWPEMVAVAADPAFRTLYWDQRFAAHPETGALVAMFWTHDRNQNGRREPHRLGFRGRPNLGDTDSDRLARAALPTGCARRESIGGHLRSSPRSAVVANRAQRRFRQNLGPREQVRLL